jgi:hypothetical protein
VGGSIVAIEALPVAVLPAPVLFDILGSWALGGVKYPAKVALVGEPIEGEGALMIPCFLMVSITSISPLGSMGELNPGRPVTEEEKLDASGEDGNPARAVLQRKREY